MKRSLFITLLSFSTALSYADSCCHATLDTADPQPLADDSVYQLGSTWNAEDGTQHDLDSFRGTVRVVVMFYASCTYACPMLVEELKQIDAKLPPDSPVIYSLFSFDPERDDPLKLRTFAERQDLTAPRWRLFTGNADAARELAAVFGVRYRKEPDGAIAHSNQITILDSEGRMAFQTQGLSGHTETVVAQLKTLLPISEMEN